MRAGNHRSHSLQSATILERKSPHSYKVVIPDGKVWNRRVDHPLQDKPDHDELTEPRPNYLGSQLRKTEIPFIPSPSTPPLSTSPSLIPLSVTATAGDLNITMQDKTH